MAMEPEHDHMLSVGALIEASKRAAQEGMLLELLQENGTLVLGKWRMCFAEA